MLEGIKKLLKGKRYFLVTSHGNTGTMWLAINLNNHQEIFCTHSYQYPIVPPIEKLNKEKRGENLLANVNKYFWQLSIDEFFDQHEDVASSRIIGNVHGFVFNRLWTMLPDLSNERKRKLRILNMIRHPVTRINSCYHHWLEGDDEKFPFLDIDIKNNCNHLHALLADKKYKVDMTYENKAFIVAVLQSEHVARDVHDCHKEGIGNIVFEDMIKDVDYFKCIFNGLTKMNLTEKDNHLFNIKNEKIKHKHNPLSELSAAQQYDAWEDWKKCLFNFVCGTSEMKKAYRPYDYDLSFVGN